MYLIKKNGNAPSTKGPALFDDFISQELFNWGNNNYVSNSFNVPAVNIKEKPDSFEIEVAAPGLEKKDFNIVINEDLLSISSSKKHNEESNEVNFTRREFTYMSFERSFKLPKGVIDENKINARYDNGILLINIPKKEEARIKSPKTIEIE